MTKIKPLKNYKVNRCMKCGDIAQSFYGYYYFINKTSFLKREFVDKLYIEHDEAESPCKVCATSNWKVITLKEMINNGKQ